MYEGAIRGALPQSWGFNNSPPPSKITTDSMVTSVDLGDSCECIVNIDSHNHIDAEDFFIDDLSEFSNEDIAAPIQIDALMDAHSNSLQSSDDNTSASNSKAPSANLKSDCTTANTSTSGSVLFHDSSAALDYKCGVSLHIEMDSSLSLPGQYETGLEWLTSFADDNLIYGASNFGMDSFLLSNAVEPFDGYDGLMKHGGFEDIDSKEQKDLKVGHTIDGAGSNGAQGCHTDCFRWDNGTGAKEFDAMMIMLPHSTGSRSARSKRARSAGWSSSNILCNNWDDSSPTNSLNSTSQIMANPPYSSPTFLPKQEEKDEQHAGYMPHHNAELIASSQLDALNRDKPLISKASKFCSNDQAFINGWAKEEENRREESVSNYSGIQPRRCTHCLSQKTPQWRAGPQGPKTLCNACGVRYKSGRLFDEYRPAKSPTFLSYKHSNSHKKVMEMRRRNTLQYNNNHHHHCHYQGAHQAHAPPASLKHAELDPHLGNKLKIKLNPPNLEPHSHYSDVTLISTTRTALESPSSFLY